MSQSDRQAESERLGRVLIVLGIIAFPIGFFTHPAVSVVAFALVIVGLIGTLGPRAAGWLERQLGQGRFHSPGAVVGVIVVAIVAGKVTDQELEPSVGDGLSMVLGSIVGLVVFVVGLAIADRLPRR